LSSTFETPFFARYLPYFPALTSFEAKGSAASTPTTWMIAKIAMWISA